MYPTVYEAFAATAAKYPANDFLILPRRDDRAWQPAGSTLSYRDVLAEVETLRRRYAEAGFGHGHRVALLLENRPAFFFHYLALNALGVGIVPINPDYRHDEILYQMTDSDADLAVVLAHRRDDLARVASERSASGLGSLPVIDADAHQEALPPARRPPPRQGSASLDSEAGLLYTSGTTGRPKGCILTNYYYLTAGQEYAAAGGLVAIAVGRERFYNPLPLFHMNHQVVTATCAMLTANCLVLPERFSPTRWWQEVSETRATIIHYLGIVAPTLLNQPPSEAERRHCVKLGVGAGIEPNLHAAFEARFGFPMVEVWGMTETGRLFWNNVEPREIDTRAFGSDTPTLKARVVDDHGNDVAPDADGELIVRHSPETPRLGFFSGYLNKPEATEEAWRNGWFHTGDVVRRSAVGMLYFVDRKKNIIRRAGENIAAAEIEAVLLAHEAVSQVAVISVADDVREEEVFACVVPMPGHAGGPALADELFAWTSTRLAYFKAPGWFLFLDTLPTTGTQKVQKTQIFASGVDPRQTAGVLDLRARKKRS